MSNLYLFPGSTTIDPSPLLGDGMRQEAHEDNAFKGGNDDEDIPIPNTSMGKL